VTVAALREKGVKTTVSKRDAGQRKVSYLPFRKQGKSLNPGESEKTLLTRLDVALVSVGVCAPSCVPSSRGKRKTALKRAVRKCISVFAIKIVILTQLASHTRPKVVESCQTGGIPTDPHSGGHHSDEWMDSEGEDYGVFDFTDEELALDPDEWSPVGHRGFS